jgi:hypothetical protein
VGKKLIALMLSLAVPGTGVAGPLKEAVEKAAREVSLAQQPPPDTGRRGRFWTGIALLAGGGVLATLGAVEVGDDETGPDDGEDLDSSDDGEDSDGWGNSALLGSGVAAASVGGWLLITGRRSSPSVTVRRDRVVLRHTFRF